MRILLFCVLAMLGNAVLAMPFADCPAGQLALQPGHAHACVEVANDEAQRERGLMFRDRLGADSGMLFVFESSDLHRMWMKDTLIPLSVAFIDEHGEIINIEDMQARTLTPHGALRPARFALEMSLGWFSRRALGPGAHIDGLPSLPR